MEYTQLGRGFKFYDKVQYEQTYDTNTGKWKCTCDAQKYKAECKHIKKFRTKVEAFLKDIRDGVIDPTYGYGGVYGS